MTAAIALSDLVVGMSRRGAPLASETGLFIALQATEALLDEPMRVSAREVHISADGEVSLSRGKSLGEQAAVVSVATLIETVIAPAPLPVRTLIERARSQQIKTLGGLRAEIEALLVPLNRSAARRVLGRLSRDLRKMDRVAAPEPEEAATAPDDEAADEPPPPAPSPPARRPASPVAHALATVPCAPPATTTDPGTALDTTPEGMSLHGAATRTFADALDTDPDGAARADVLRSVDERAWLDVDATDDDADGEEEGAEDALATTPRGDARARDVSSDADDALDSLPLPARESRGGSGAWMAFFVLLALAGAAYAWHRTVTGVSVSALTGLAGR